MSEPIAGGQGSNSPARVPRVRAGFIVMLVFGVFLSLIGVGLTIGGTAAVALDTSWQGG